MATKKTGGKAPMQRPTPAQIKKVENSAADRAADRRAGTRENSPADRKQDAALAKKMSGGKKGR